MSQQHEDTVSAVAATTGCGREAAELAVIACIDDAGGDLSAHGVVEQAIETVRSQEDGLKRQIRLKRNREAAAKKRKKEKDEKGAHPRRESSRSLDFSEWSLQTQGRASELDVESSPPVHFRRTMGRLDGAWSSPAHVLQRIAERNWQTAGRGTKDTGVHVSALRSDAVEGIAVPTPPADLKAKIPELLAMGAAYVQVYFGKHIARAVLSDVLGGQVMCPPGVQMKNSERCLQLFLSMTHTKSLTHRDATPSILHCQAGMKTVYIAAPDVHKKYKTMLTREDGQADWLQFDPFKADPTGRWVNVFSRCSLLPGEAIFIPKDWWHCIFSTPDTVGISIDVAPGRQGAGEVGGGGGGGGGRGRGGGGPAGTGAGTGDGVPGKDASSKDAGGMHAFGGHGGGGAAAAGQVGAAGVGGGCQRAYDLTHDIGGGGVQAPGGGGAAGARPAAARGGSERAAAADSCVDGETSAVGEGGAPPGPGPDDGKHARPEGADESGERLQHRPPQHPHEQVLPQPKRPKISTRVEGFQCEICDAADSDSLFCDDRKALENTRPQYLRCSSCAGTAEGRWVEISKDKFARWAVHTVDWTDSEEDEAEAVSLPTDSSDDDIAASDGS